MDRDMNVNVRLKSFKIKRENQREIRFPFEQTLLYSIIQITLFCLHFCLLHMYDYDLLYVNDDDLSHTVPF
ncbi:hypothetical protein SDJN03_28573, partial [Cucurbita argyrosperma subsp. sororia]